MRRAATGNPTDIGWGFPRPWHRFESCAPVPVFGGRPSGPGAGGSAARGLAWERLTFSCSQEVLGAHRKGKRAKRRTLWESLKWNANGV